MPELPEVETIVRELGHKLKNKKIKAIEVKIPKMVNLSVARFKRQLIGSSIKKVSRRAKMIIIKLSNELYLLIHLKLTGQLVYRRRSGKIAAVGGHPIIADLQNLPNKFSHIIFTFTDGSHLFYNDIRQFGWMKIADSSSLLAISREYGIESFTSDFTLNNFQKVLNKYPQRKIKQILLDQKLVAGVGNIYADESCFCSKIKPMRLVKTLNSKKIKDLFHCITTVMRAAIAKGGTSADTYVRVDGTEGGFLPYLKVYGRGGEKCKRCKGIIKKTKLNGRGTHYCEQCQK
jgi:formamidopyrimidine-DNA glycosylase